MLRNLVYFLCWIAIGLLNLAGAGRFSYRSTESRKKDNLRLQRRYDNEGKGRSMSRVHGEDKLSSNTEFSFRSSDLDIHNDRGKRGERHLTEINSVGVNVSDCVNNFTALEYVIINANNNSNVTICDGSFIRVERELIIHQDRLTLSCEGYRCILDANGTTRILNVPGNSFALERILLKNGRVNGNRTGGNILIYGGGNHMIKDCTLLGGSSHAYGGNFDFSKGSLTVTNTSFENGHVTCPLQRCGGGGMSVFDAVDIFITDCVFRNNSAEFTGGGLDVEMVRDMFVDGTVFAANEAYLGAGAFARKLSFGHFVESSFSENEATNGGGVGVFDTSNNVYIEGNNFVRNVAVRGGAGYIFHDVTSHAMLSNTGSANSAINCSDVMKVIDINLYEYQCLPLL